MNQRSVHHGEALGVAARKLLIRAKRGGKVLALAIDVLRAHKRRSIGHNLMQILKSNVI